MTRNSSALLVCAIGASLVACGGKNFGPSPIPSTSVSQIVTKQIILGKIPGITAAVVTGDKIKVGGGGMRRASVANDPVKISDQFHIGSCTKSMTAMVIAKLVEQKKIKWTDKIVSFYSSTPATAFRPEYQAVTIEQLLYHRSGLPAYPVLSEINTVPQYSGSIIEKRAKTAEYLLKQAPEEAFGNFGYSNAGYTIAGSIIEKVSGLTYELALKKYIFGPLGMTSASLGWPGQDGSPAPWGHYFDPDTNVLTEINPTNPETQFPVVWNSAGNVYMSPGDMGKYLRAHLNGLNGKSNILSPASYQKLHTPAPNTTSEQDYAMGWVSLQIGGVKTSWHNGSTDVFYAEMAIAPSINKAGVVIANKADEAANTGVTNALRELLVPTP